MSGPSPAGPSPALGPAEVVALLLETLASADPTGPDDAAERVHAFSSLAMRARVGGPGGLARSLRSPLYAPLLGHVSVVREPLEQIEHAARQRVNVTAADGTRAAYLLALARRDEGGCAGCWLLSGLARDDL